MVPAAIDRGTYLTSDSIRVIFQRGNNSGRNYHDKKSREGHICQVSWACVDVVTYNQSYNTSNRFTFGHFFAKIQEFQKSDVTVSRTSVTICIT